MNLLLGFPAVIVPAIPANSITSTMVAGFVTIKSININSSLINGIDNGFINWAGGTPTNSQTLYNFPISSCFGVIMQSGCLDIPFFPITNSKFSLVDSTEVHETAFWLTFPDGTPVNLNGQDWEMVLVFDFNQPHGG